MTTHIINDRARFIHVFGKREMELAAIAILDAGLLDADIRREDVADEARGFELLVEHQWLVPTPQGRFRASPEFTARVVGAAARDRAEGITL